MIRMCYRHGWLIKKRCSFINANPGIYRIMISGSLLKSITKNMIKIKIMSIISKIKQKLRIRRFKIYYFLEDVSMQIDPLLYKVILLVKNI
jgi:hypothetical protein